MTSRIARLAVNTVTSYGRFIISLVVMFLLTPYVIQKLGAEDFGLWSLVFSVLGFLGLLDLGLGTATTKFAAEGRGTGDLDRRNGILSTIGAMYLILALLAAGAVSVLALSFTRLFDVAQAHHDVAGIIVVVLGLRTVILALPLSLYRAVLFGSQRIDLVNLVQVVGTAAYGLGAWLGLRAGGSLVTLALINLGAMLVEHVLYVVLAYIYVPDLKLGPSRVSKSYFREAGSFSAATFVVSVAGLVLLRTDPIVVSIGTNLAGVAVYAIALKIAENSLLLSKQFVNILGPLIAELHAGGEREQVRQVLIRASKFSLIPAGGITAALVVLGRDAVVFWVGPEFAGAGPVLTILLLSVCIVVPQMVASNVLTMTGHHAAVARAAIISAVINLLLSVALVFPLGLIGVALATLLSSLIVDLGHVIHLTCRVMNVGYGRYLWRVYCPVLAAGAAQALVTWGISWRWPPANLLQVVLYAVPGGLVYLALNLVLFFDAAEKELLLKRLRRKKATKSSNKGEE